MAVPESPVPADPLPDRLPELVRVLRERAILSQEELADRSTLSVRTIRGLESDRLSRPRGRSVRLLADALGLAGPDRERLFDAARAVSPRSRPGRAVPAATGLLAAPAK